MTIKIIQSFREHDVPSWIQTCLASVRDWADYHDYGYEFVGDALLDRVPVWYREKAGDKIPVVTDLARLLWAQSCLDRDEADILVWLDADTYILAPEELTVDMCGDNCVLGREYWLQRDKKGKPRLYNNVHNAYCAFKKGSPVLPFLIYTVERLMTKVDGNFIAPQFVGPKLLTSLHNTVGFSIDPRFGAISPMLAKALVESDQSLLSALGERDVPMLAANLSHSLSDEIHHEDLMAVFASRPHGI